MIQHAVFKELVKVRVVPKQQQQKKKVDDARTIFCRRAVLVGGPRREGVDALQREEQRHHVCRPAGQRQDHNLLQGQTSLTRDRKDTLTPLTCHINVRVHFAAGVLLPEKRLEDVPHMCRHLSSR